MKLRFNFFFALARCRAFFSLSAMNLFTIRKIGFAIFRRRRMRHFYATFRPSDQTRLLDIGGAPNTWLSESDYPRKFPITLVNLRYPDLHMLTDDRFTPISGDATRLPFADASFDIAFSNSVIEHMTSWERQLAFASEARRVARKLWIQTPARCFPIEPHLLAPLFQYLPRKLQVLTARRLTLWGLLTKPSRAQVIEMLSEIRLLTYGEMKQLFPDCAILKERFLGLTKSYLAVRADTPGEQLTRVLPGAPRLDFETWVKHQFPEDSSTLSHD